MLFDYIKKEFPHHILEYKQGIKVFNIQNVYDFIVKMEGRKYYGPNDIYSFYPPFPATWFEFEETEDYLFIPKYVEKYCNNSKMKNEPKLKYGMIISRGGRVIKMEGLPISNPDSFPTVSVSLYCKPIIKHSRPIYLGKKMYIVDEYGRFAYHIHINGYNPETKKIETHIVINKDHDDNQNIIGYGFAPSIEFEKILDKTQLSEHAKNLWKVIIPENVFPIMGLALNFLHCKNVTIEREKYGPITVQKDKYGKKKEFRKYYHILSIEPMKKILESSGNAKETGIKRAFHICRGHFRTYSETKKLFGKVAGTFWIENHVRGSKEVGEVYKDYDFDSKSVDIKKIKSRIK